MSYGAVVKEILYFPMVLAGQITTLPYGTAAAVAALYVGYRYGGVPSLDNGVQALAMQYVVTGTALAAANYAVTMIAPSGGNGGVGTGGGGIGGY